VLPFSVNVKLSLRSSANSVNGTALAKAASNGFFDIGVLRNDTLPYDTMTIQLRSRTLASFLLNNLRMDRYVISTEHAGHFSNIIDGGLGPKLGSLSKALVYLSVHLYYKPAATDLHLAREQVASTLLREIEARVKPSKLQSMQKSELQALILVLLVTIMTLKLRSMDSVSHTNRRFSLGLTYNALAYIRRSQREKIRRNTSRCVGASTVPLYCEDSPETLIFLQN
jgi:hypothetical protein